MVDIEERELNLLFQNLAHWTDILKDVEEVEPPPAPGPKGPSPC